MTREFIETEIIDCQNGQFGLRFSSKEGTKQYRNVTTDKEKLILFAKKINQNKVSHIHIDEMLEDFLP